MKRLFDFLIIIFVFVACTKSNQNEKVKTNDLKIDTLISKGDEIIFFKPTKNEFEDLVNKYGKESGIYEADGAFDKYIDSISSVYSKWNFIKFPSQRIIRIIAFDGSTSYLDRQKLPGVYGIIFNISTSEPVIEYGIRNNEGIHEMIRRVKGLKPENIVLNEFTEEKIEFEIKDNPKEFFTNEKYWVKLKVKEVDDKKIVVASNNGRIYQSDLKDYDYMFIPEKNRKMIIGVYKKLEKLELCGEIEINEVKSK